MRYSEALKAAAFEGWFHFLEPETIHGNGFDFVRYGLWLLIKYLLLFLLRLAFAALAPLTAFILMKAEKERVKYDREAARKANEDL